MPARSWRTPIGARQSVGGGGSLASWIARKSFFGEGGVDVGALGAGGDADLLTK
jgi:hypothetical protein